VTSYSTCINCATDKVACGRRNEVRAAIKGTGITSVKFRCADRKSMFHAGQRVAVTWTVGGDGYELDETWPATVIRESGNRFVLSVDDVDSDEGTPARGYIRNEQLFVKVSPHRLQKLDEPDRKICEFCQLTPGFGDICKNKDELWGGDGSPPDCILKMQVTACAAQ
jgi:hypothetical protein